MSAKAQKPRSIRRRHHKVDRLPAHLLDQVRERVQRGEPYERVEAWLVGQGEHIGHSSLHRWHCWIRNELPRITERTELARMIISAGGVDPLVVQNAVYLEFYQLFLDLLVGDDLELDELTKLATAAARLGGTSTSLSGHLDERRRAQIAEANKKLESMADQGQLPEAVVEKIKRLYGLQTPAPEEPKKS